MHHAWHGSDAAMSSHISAVAQPFRRHHAGDRRSCADAQGQPVSLRPCARQTVSQATDCLLILFCCQCRHLCITQNNRHLGKHYRVRSTTNHVAAVAQQLLTRSTTQLRPLRAHWRRACRWQGRDTEHVREEQRPHGSSSADRRRGGRCVSRPVERRWQTEGLPRSWAGRAFGRASSSAF